MKRLLALGVTGLLTVMLAAPASAVGNPTPTEQPQWGVTAPGADWTKGESRVVIDSPAVADIPAVVGSPAVADIPAVIGSPAVADIPAVEAVAAVADIPAVLAVEGKPAVIAKAEVNHTEFRYTKAGSPDQWSAHGFGPGWIKTNDSKVVIDFPAVVGCPAVIAVVGHPFVKGHPAVAGSPFIKGHPAVIGSPFIKGHPAVIGTPFIKGHDAVCHTEWLWTPPIRQPREVTETYTWRLPVGGMWPQTLVGAGTLTPPCDVTYQVDTYKGTREAIDAIVKDGKLVAGEDSRVVQSWKYLKGDKCPPTPPVKPADKVVVSEWTNGTWPCDAKTVVQTRTITTTPYVWSKGIETTAVDKKPQPKGEWILGTPVVITQTQTRDLTATEFKACPVVVVPPVVTPPVVTTVVVPKIVYAAPVIVAPKVVKAPAKVIVTAPVSEKVLASTGFDSLWYAMGAAGLIGLGVLGLTTVGRMRKQN